MLSRLIASSERTGILGSWLSAQARNCRAHSWGLLFCRWAMETGCTDWSASSSIHCSRLNPRARAWALNAASDLKLSRPLLGIAFLQVGNGNGLHRLVGKFQHPLLKAQPARPRLGLERRF